MRRKTALTLVCKAWHAYAQEVLFEFVWVSRASEARALAALLLRDGPGGSNGNYIRRLHIETSPLERCCPVDLRTILDHAPRLVVYSDYRSVRRSFHDRSCTSSPQQLLSTLAHPNNSLKRLSWTNYDDISFHLTMSPMLETTAAKLEFLELNFCSTHLHSMFPSFSSPLCVPPESDSITLTLPALRSLKVTLDNATFTVLSKWSMPALENLSVLSADFSYASSGFSQFFMVHGPKLLQLELGHSSSSIEEHYLTAPPPPLLPPLVGGTGDAATMATMFGGSGNRPRRISLAACCPNLEEFICSADADWNWQRPDWIAPHILLPSHPSLQFIGIRDIDKRLRDDMHLAFGNGGGYEEDDTYGEERNGGGEEPFFRLLEQIGSLARREAFPALRYIRDLSWESDVMRRGGSGVDCQPVSAGDGVGPSSTIGIPQVLSRSVSWLRRRGLKLKIDRGRDKGKMEQQAVHKSASGVSRETKMVLRFWRKVLECCREGSMWMEDYRGVNVTMRDLRRVEAGIPGAVGKLRFEGFGLGCGW